MIKTAENKVPFEISDTEKARTEQGHVVSDDDESRFCDQCTCLKWTFTSIVLILGVYGMLAYIIANETSDKGDLCTHINPTCFADRAISQDL